MSSLQSARRLECMTSLEGAGGLERVTSLEDARGLESVTGHFLMCDCGEEEYVRIVD